MQIDWFLVELAVITIPLLLWGYWMVMQDGDPNDRDRQPRRAHRAR
jgi:hypothetical protein